MKASTKTSHLERALHHVQSHLTYLRQSYDEARIRATGAQRQAKKLQTDIQKAEAMLALLNPPANTPDSDAISSDNNSDDDQSSSDDESPEAGTMMAKKDKTYNPAKHG